MGSCDRPRCARRTPRTALVRLERRVAGPAVGGGASGEQGWIGSSCRPLWESVGGCGLALALARVGAGAGLARPWVARDGRVGVRGRRGRTGRGLSPLGVLDRLAQVGKGQCLVELDQHVCPRAVEESSHPGPGAPCILGVPFHPHDGLVDDPCGRASRVCAFDA
eukprot:1749487-Amphidinium_carterae.1